MDEKTRRRIELEGAEALLDIGVSVPLKSFRLPFRKKPVQWRVTMRRPTLGTHAAFAREYLKLGLTPEKMKKFTKEEEMEFLARHGKTLSRMVAVTLLRGPLRRRLLLGLTACWPAQRSRPTPPPGSSPACRAPGLLRVLSPRRSGRTRCGRGRAKERGGVNEGVGALP